MKTQIAIGVVAAAVAVGAGLAVLAARRRAAVVMYDSALRTVHNETVYALDIHFAHHGQYPSDLRLLEYPRGHGDEFCESMFRDLIYSSHGTNYDLTEGTNRLGFGGYLDWRKTQY